MLLRRAYSVDLLSEVEQSKLRDNLYLYHLQEKAALPIEKNLFK